MLERITLRNFRGFREHIVPFRDLTVAVGRNNAGKSTIAEALRLISLVATRYTRLNFTYPPDWTELPRRARGVYPSTRDLEMNTSTLFYQYSEPPATIGARFTNHASIELRIGLGGEAFATITSPLGRPVQTRSGTADLDLPSVSIMPQPEPLQRYERRLAPDYVRSRIGSHLSSQHFRNQLLLFHGQPEFRTFCELAGRTWPGLRVHQLIKPPLETTNPIELHIRDRNFVAEVGSMGHGLQMWLQTIWFLARARRSATIILDEPDVYLHADLQRRLMKHLAGSYRQVIVTTHSVEVMAEVEPEQILIVDRGRGRSDFATGLPVVQRVVEGIGSSANLQFARLWTSKRFIYVEGKDVRLLREWHATLFPEALFALDVIPNCPVGGWDGWAYAVGSTRGFKNALGDEIIFYCFLDSDYHTDHQVEGRLKDARKKGVELHIWRKKEIENYLLDEQIIARLISRQARGTRKPPTAEEARTKTLEIAGQFKEDMFNAYAESYQKDDRAGGLTMANRRAQKHVPDPETDPEDFLRRAPGKEVLRGLATWARAGWGVNLTAQGIARAAHANEIDTEIADVLRKVEAGEPLAEGRWSRI